MGSEWQTVQGPKNKGKTKASKAQDAQANGYADGASGNLRASDPAGAVLAQIDADWNNTRSYRSKQTAAPANGLGSFDTLEVEPSPPPSPKAQARHQAPEAPPKKATKPKKPKAKRSGTAEIGARIDISELKKVLDGIEQKYSTDEAVQLEIFADHFLTLFKDADIPFNKTVAESSYSKAAEVPLQDVPSAVQDQALAFLQKKSSDSMSQLAAKLITAFFGDIPESAHSKITPPKAKVGMLVALSLMLKQRPSILLNLAPRFLENAGSFSLPRKLPFQLWLLSQAARSNVAVPVAFWTRVLLPQILGSDLPLLANQKPPLKPVSKMSASASSSALSYMRETLEQQSAMGGKSRLIRVGPLEGDPKGYWALKASETALLHAASAGIDVQEGSKPVLEPLVPSGAIEAIVRACCVGDASFGPLEARNSLLHILEELRELHLAGIASGVNKPHDAVRLLLETASGNPEAPSSSAGVPQELVEEATRNLIDLFMADPSGVGTSWEQRHKHQIRGSAAILRNLQVNPQKLTLLLKNKARSDIFLSTLQHLRERHKGLVTYGKSWQQSRAKAADKSLVALTASVQSGRKSRAASNVALIAAFIVVLLVFLSRQEVFQDGVDRLRKIESVDRVLTTTEAGLAQGGRILEPFLRPVRDQAVLLGDYISKRVSKAVADRRAT